MGFTGTTALRIYLTLLYARKSPWDSDNNEPRKLRRFEMTRQSADLGHSLRYKPTDKVMDQIPSVCPNLQRRPIEGKDDRCRRMSLF